MTMITWTLAFHNSQIGFGCPDTNAVDAFGTHHPTALSPASRDMKKLLLALAEDIAKNYYSGNFLWEFLMSLSFGREISAQAVKKGIEMKDIHAVIRGVNTEVKISTLDFGPLSGLGPYGTSWQNGMDLNKWLPYIDEVHPAFYEPQEQCEEKRDAYLAVLNKLPEKIAMIPAIRCIAPQVTCKQALRQRLDCLRAHSQGFTFYNYGFMPYKTLEWIKAALV